MDKAATLTPDQVVSRNLTRARELRGWTQQKAAAEVSRYLGKEWSVPVYSAAERSHRTPRVKEFSATEIMAFCRAFRLPLEWFFLPPGPWTVIAPRGGTGVAVTTGDELLSLLFPLPDDPALAELEEAATELWNALAAQKPPRENLPTYLASVRRQNMALQTMLRTEFQAEDLGSLPEILEDAAGKMRRALGLVVNDLLHDGIPPPAPEE